MPQALFGEQIWAIAKSILILLVGGILMVSETRYAGGCTSGHAISG